MVAALSLAGIGPDRTVIESWADPGVSRNCHEIRVEFELGAFHDVDRKRSVRKSQTGRITALSVIAALRKLTTPLRIGT